MSGVEITTIFSSALIILLMVVFIIIFMIRYQRRLLLHQEELTLVKVTHERELQQAILESQEYERGRIATDLHDDLGSLLATIKLKILRKNKSEPQTTDDEIADMLADGIETVRNVSRELLPLTLKKYGLNAALQELANKFINVDGFSINVTSIGQEQILEERTLLMLYRIFQELMNNGLRHAQTSRMDWELEWSPTQLKLAYQDWGIGFQPDISKYGLGITNITTRITLLDGSFTLESAPSQGTRITMIIPLKNQVE